MSPESSGKRVNTAAERYFKKREKSVMMEEARELLRERGIEPLADWRPGEPLLVLLDDKVRGNNGPFKDLPLERRPNFVRLDAPTHIRPVNDIQDRELLGITLVHAIANETGAQIDYYAIDAETKLPVLVKTSNSVKTKNEPYFAEEGTLFMPNDDLFPKSEPKD